MGKFCASPEQTLKNFNCLSKKAKVEMMEFKAFLSCVRQDQVIN